MPARATTARRTPPRKPPAPGRVDGGALAHVNEVRLLGRLAAEPVPRELPSGDLLVQFRLVVDRPAATTSGDHPRPTVDTIDCAAWRKDVHRSLRSVVADDLLEVEGSLRRRFWRSAAGAMSRSEVEVVRVRRVRRAERIAE